MSKLLNRRDAIAILACVHGDELAEVLDVPVRFELLHFDVAAGGGQQGTNKPIRRAASSTALERWRPSTSA